MMTSVDRRVTGGVDTHDDVHVAAVCDTDNRSNIGHGIVPDDHHRLCRAARHG